MMNKEVISNIVDNKIAKLQVQLAEAEYHSKLTIVSVGDDPASKVYVNNKIKLLEKVGIEASHLQFPQEFSDQAQLDALARDAQFPMLFQLPLPNGLQAPELPPELDVDAFSAQSLGLVAAGEHAILPCTVQACIDIMDHQLGEDAYPGLKVAIIGRSKIVGLPLAIDLINRQCQVTSFNSKSDLNAVNWDEFDVVVVAVGYHGVVKASDFKRGLIIDVGINRLPSGKLAGDVEHDVESAADITPVPGGVGRLTVTNVVANALILCEQLQHPESDNLISVA